MLKKGIRKGLEQSAEVGGNGGTIRFLESPNDPWRNGYRIVSPSEFMTMKPSLVGQPNGPTPHNQCPGCEIDATKAGKS